MRFVESVTLVASSLAGGVLAGLTTPRLTYFLTVPFALASIVALLRFDEPQLHKAEPGGVAAQPHRASRSRPSPDAASCCPPSC